MHLVDYAEDKKLHEYYLCSASLVLLFLGLFLVLKKELSIHGSTKFPIVGIEAPGYLGLVKARDKFVSDASNIIKNGYHKVSFIQFAQLLALVYFKISKVLTL